MHDDRGSAALEFITVGVILLVPLVYLIVALGSIQEHTLGAEAAARHLARVIASAPDAETAAAHGDRVVENIADQYGIERGSLEVSVTCAPRAAECPAPGALVTVTVATRVPLPLVPSVLGLDLAASIPVEGVAVQKVSRLWGAS
ncbi:TadE family protein [Microbacterium hydrocarbonoxydans]|uniref:TadE family protein n=1 Tax=Microbacterium hydrocarbonoxydans TaxID=273678 RepID=UPI002040DD20|nr:TadE family protein [Microbacterium hydrocarbonoxydans]MCM3780263.1 TadE family protein [Microbacterium hydrocarbonoxydans]